MKITDVTDKVNHRLNWEDCLPICKCVCGKELDGWMLIIGLSSDDPKECPNCGAKLYFTIEINVYQVEDEEGEE